MVGQVGGAEWPTCVPMSTWNCLAGLGLLGQSPHVFTNHRLLDYLGVMGIKPIFNQRKPTGLLREKFSHLQEKVGL